MNGVGHGREIDDPGAAFERVKGAKRAVQPFLVCGHLFQRQQIGDCLLDVLAGFDQELFDELVHAPVPQRSAATSASLSRLTGLTR